ncbi:MAG: glycosyltransferase [Thermodesulfobacteriota bacterium]
MNTPACPDCWEFFDKLYCISLEERGDRRAEAVRQFRKVGLADRVEFVIFQKNHGNSEQGIFDSHMCCIRKGIQAGARNMVIFEDDILFERFSAARLKRSTEFLAREGTWKAFFLGCLVTGSRPTDERTVIRIQYRSLAHAYALNRPFAEKLALEQWREIPFDSMVCRLDRDQYALYPSIAFQANTRTDNQRFVQLDRYRRLCGGLRCIQKLNEIYYRRKLAVIVLHLLFLAAIIMAVS